MQDRAPSAEVPQMPADTLPDLLIDTMGPLAERGSIEAMRELGRGLHDCATSDSGSDVMIERKFIEALVSTEELMKAAGQDFSADQQAAEARAAIEKTKRVRDACRDIDIVRSRSWADWTERAARAGDERAMRYYIEWARFELHLRVRELWTLDDWVTRRNTAYEFAGRLLAAGDCDMLFIRSDLAPNPSLAYIYGHAALERLRSAAITGPADDLPAHLQALDSSTASLAMAVPGDGLVAASNAARGILDSYCSP